MAMKDVEVSPILLIVLAVLAVILFVFLIFRHGQTKSRNEKLRLQNQRLKAIGNIYYSMHIINLVEDTVQEVNSSETLRKIADIHDITQGATDMMKKIISTVVVPEQVEEALEFTDLSTLADRMKGEKTFFGEFKTPNSGWIRARFIMIDQDSENRPVNVIIATVIVDKEKKKEEGLIQISQTDELTGAGNRRAYEEKIAECEKDIPDNLVVLSFDLNELKIVNDSQGHDAGDEMIVGAVDCIKKSFAAYGEVYRTGGDEFAAIINCDTKQLRGILDDFENVVGGWSGKLVPSISVSTGYAARIDNKDATVHEMLVLADSLMNQAKGEYYRHKGIDRRGQKDAHTALCQLYTKILKINITDDTYSIVDMSDEEKTPEKGFADSISGWLSGFAGSGQVHQDDVKHYLEMTDANYLREYFAAGNMNRMIFYRRKIGNEYRKVMMEIIPANDYRNDNQSLYLYVKNIDTNISIR